MHFGTVLNFTHQLKKKVHSHSDRHAHSHDLDECQFHTNLARNSHQFSTNLAFISRSCHMYFPCGTHCFPYATELSICDVATRVSARARARSRRRHPLPYQSRPILAHELEEATYDSDDLHVGSIVEWAGNQQPPR